MKEICEVRRDEWEGRRIQKGKDPKVKMKEDLVEEGKVRKMEEQDEKRIDF